jgi:NAD(P)-dependent dehydrogenase (short-subunit alcohol dehydrogenase family)
VAHVLDVNVVGSVNTMRAFVPGMAERGWGRVVNLASMAGKDGNPGLAAYSAAKAAVIALTKSAGKELATTGVPGQRDRAGGHRHADERGDRARRAGAHHRPHPDEAGRPARGGRRAGRLPVLRPGQLLHRRRLRHQRRPRHY